MGEGLRRADPAEPCVRVSRAPALVPVRVGGTTESAVVSYYDAI
ncbi:MAG: hypothetical protein O9284_18765 [Steroidobacteraceae bacterium]|jgi:hypothetical protein|nr:hypothetical protein [Steroidobacteraceae bacterium]